MIYPGSSVSCHVAVLEYVQRKAFMEGRSACQPERKQELLFVALIIVIGQYLIVTFGGPMFSVIPLSLKDWGIIIGSTSLVLWIGELGRFISRMANKRRKLIFSIVGFACQEKDVHLRLNMTSHFPR